MNAPAAIAAIRARAARFRAGDRSADGRKLALVVEGGALRGVCSAGGVVALEDLRLTDVFDHVYGTSAGVMNASYFVAGQARLGIRIYYEDMNRRSIVNPWRFWKILDLERLFQRAVMGNKRLDVDAVLAARSRLFIATLEVGAAAGRLFEAQALGTGEKLLGALKAATAAPLLVHGRLSVEGARCMDAGIVNAFPVEEAIAHGCTDVLVMLTRPVGYRRRAADRLSRWLFNRVCAAGNPQLARAFAIRHEGDARQRDLAFGRAPVPPGVNIATICTDDDETVDRLTRDARLLRAGALSFGRKTLRAFGADADSWIL
ncbi:MAG: patatin-like phospholipase family protein [Pseudomonadota bacterium]